MEEKGEGAETRPPRRTNNQEPSKIDIFAGEAAPALTDSGSD
jgi:hypothetical protein